MKNRIFGGIALLVIAVVAAWNVNLSSKNDNLSTISLANIEALAEGNENGDQRSRCSIEWYATVLGQVVKLSCNADCAPGQKAQCKQNDCRCV
jgi:hypothetical protein